MAETGKRKRNRDYDRERDDSEQVDLLGIVYALITMTMFWIGFVTWNVVESCCWSS